MQLEKFDSFVQNHFELNPCLRELRSHLDGRPMPDIVQLQLEYLAIRPWKSLDLGLTGSYTVSHAAQASVRYTVYAHIEGEEISCTRARSSYTPKDSTVQQLIDELSGWHKEYWAKRENRPLVFDAVTRTSRLVKDKKEHWFDDKIAMSFYLFPEGFTA